MRRLTIWTLCIGAAIALNGCRSSQPAATPRRVVCSIFPVWLLARNVAEGRTGVAVELLLPAGLGCPHDYVVTPQDARKIEAADVLIINGLGLDDFAADRFRKGKPDGKVIVATEGLSTHDHAAHEHDHNHDHGHEHHHDENPHLFSSPRMAARMAVTIAEGLAAVDPEGAGTYKTNAAKLAQRLEELADEIQAATRELPNKRVIAQHDVLEAFAADAGLEIVGYIHAHAGHDPSAEEIIRLVKTARERGAAAVMVEPQYSARVGETVAHEAGIEVGTFDPVASGPDNAAKDHYEVTMRRNVEELRRVLSSRARPAR